MIYRDISLRQLTFAILKPPTLPSRFNRLVTETLRTKTCAITLSIIGESHLVQISGVNDEPMLAETVFCGHRDIAEHAERSSHFSGKEPSFETLADYGHLIYHFKARARSITTESARLRDTLRNPDPHWNRLYFQFPSDKSLPIYSTNHDYRRWLEPATVIEYGYDPLRSSLRLRTLHIYPNDGQFLETHSRFDFRPDA